MKGELERILERGPRERGRVGIQVLRGVNQETVKAGVQ